MATLVDAATAEKKASRCTDEKAERKPQRARVDDKFKIFCGTANEALADEVCALSRADARAGAGHALPGRRVLRADSGERARR